MYGRLLTSERFTGNHDPCLVRLAQIEGDRPVQWPEYHWAGARHRRGGDRVSGCPRKIEGAGRGLAVIVQACGLGPPSS